MALSRRILGFLFLGVWSSSCRDASQSAPPASQIQRIIGDSQYVEVADDGSNIPASLMNYADAVGHLSGGCTVTHLGEGYAITAGHCVLPLLYFDVEFPQYNIPCEQTVEWGVRSSRQPTLTGKCEKFVTGELNARNDWAIIKFDKYPDAKIEVEQTRDPAPGDQLTLLSHPQNRPLIWSQYCQWQENVHVNAASENQFSFDCDTEGGSSGGSVLDVASGKIIGTVVGSGFDGSPSHGIPAEEFNYGQRATRIPLVADIIARDKAEIVSTPYAGPLAFRVKYTQGSVLGLRFTMESDVFAVVEAKRGHVEVLRDWMFGIGAQALVISRNSQDYFTYETLVQERSLLLPRRNGNGEIEALTLALDQKIRRTTDAEQERNEQPLPEVIPKAAVENLTYFPQDQIFSTRLKFSGILFQTKDVGAVATLKLKSLKPFWGGHYRQRPVVSFDGNTFVDLYRAWQINVENNPIGPQENGLGTPTEHEFKLKVMSSAGVE